MPKVEEWQKKTAWIASGILGLLILLAGFLLWGATAFDDCIIFAVLAVISVPTVLNLIDHRWKKSIDERVPDLFRAIVQAQQIGMTLPQAIEEASKRDYGPLSKELRKLVSQMSWGSSFEEALESLEERVDTMLVKRTVPLIIEASRSGGHAEKVFDPIGKFIQITLTLEKERNAQTRPYVAIIYVAFFVFLFTIVLLFKTFFMPISQNTSILGNVLLTPDAASVLFFRMTVLQAFFSGLVAGKMGEGNISSGLKHSIILLTCGYLVFKIIL